MTARKLAKLRDTQQKLAVEAPSVDIGQAVNSVQVSGAPLNITEAGTFVNDGTSNLMQLPIGTIAGVYNSPAISSVFDEVSNLQLQTSVNGFNANISSPAEVTAESGQSAQADYFYDLSQNPSSLDGENMGDLTLGNCAMQDQDFFESFIDWNSIARDIGFVGHGSMAKSDLTSEHAQPGSGREVSLDDLVDFFSM